jgi:hypothetical protein
MNPIGYRPPEKWQLESLHELIGIVPIEEINWLLKTGNLEYYTAQYQRASDLINHLRKSAIKYH